MPEDTAMKSFTKWQFMTLILVLGLVCLAGWCGWSGLKWRQVEWTALTSQLGTLALVALFIERTIEVVVSVWRQQRADELENQIKSAKAEEKPTLEKDMLIHAAGTRRIARGTGFVIGTFVALVGVRVLEQWVDAECLKTLAQASSIQLFCFRLTDTLLTGAMLAGGTDPIHRVLTLFNTFVDASTRKADALKPK